MVVKSRHLRYTVPMPKRFPVIWLTGNTGSGKSTLAFAMRNYFNEEASCDLPAARRVIVLDGDEMRESISTQEDLSPEGRRVHNLRVARLAKLLSDTGFLVLVSVIAPFKSVREELEPICNPQWVYIKRKDLKSEDKPYEPPENSALVIDNDSLSIEEGREQLKKFLGNL